MGRVAALLAAVALAPAGARAQDRDEPVPIEIRVGATLDVCTTGRVVCPAMYPRCDDPKIAVPVVEHLDGGGWRLGLKRASRSADPPIGAGASPRRRMR